MNGDGEGDGTAGEARSAVLARRRRRCLMCRVPFESAGAHERVCAACKESEDWRDAAAATQGHTAW